MPANIPQPVRWSSLDPVVSPDGRAASPPVARLPPSAADQMSAAGLHGWTKPRLLPALMRGFAGRCPCCGRGKVFDGWLRQVPNCSVCQAPLGAARADDAPPYFVIFIVAHLVIGAQVMTEFWLTLSLTAEAAIFLPLTLALCMVLLRPVKGATIGLMMRLDMVQQAVVAP